MAQQPPAPAWHDRDERKLEDLVCGEDEADARAAHDELWRRHDAVLRRYAKRQCGRHTTLADDAMQDLYIRTWEKRQLYSPEKGRWITWARMILCRIVIDLFRKQLRFSQTPADCADDEKSPSNASEPQARSREQQVDWWIKLAEFKQSMGDCLRNLSPEERKALILQVFKELKLREIAAQTQTPPATIGTRVYRAREKMRQCLREKGIEGGEV